MSAMILRLLTIFAIALMPLGMAAVPASAAPVNHHQAMQMAGGHCDDMGKKGDTAPAQMDCKAMCSAAAFSSPQVDQRLPIPRPLLKMARIAAAHGVEPEFDPPPPKRG